MSEGATATRETVRVQEKELEVMDELFRVLSAKTLPGLFTSAYCTTGIFARPEAELKPFFEGIFGGLMLRIGSLKRSR